MHLPLVQVDLCSLTGAGRLVQVDLCSATGAGRLVHGDWCRATGAGQHGAEWCRDMKVTNFSNIAVC